MPIGYFVREQVCPCAGTGLQPVPKRFYLNSKAIKRHGLQTPFCPKKIIVREQVCNLFPNVFI
jgi:hypothetical protein